MAKKESISAKFGKRVGLSAEEMIKMSQTVQNDFTNSNFGQNDDDKTTSDSPSGDVNVVIDTEKEKPVPVVSEAPVEPVKPAPVSIENNAPAGASVSAPSASVVKSEGTEANVEDIVTDREVVVRTPGKGKKSKHEVATTDEWEFEDYLDKYELTENEKFTSITVSDNVNQQFKIISAHCRGVYVRDMMSNILAKWLMDHEKEIEKLKKSKK